MVNKVILIGNLGADIELQHTQAGDSVANFSIATSERWKDRDGNDQEKTEWHKIVVWRKLAENCAEYIGKGSKVYVEGSLQTQKWQDRDGNDRYTTEVKAFNVRFLDGKKSSEAPGYSGQAADGPSPIDDEDIPF